MAFDFSPLLTSKVDSRKAAAEKQRTHDEDEAESGKKKKRSTQKMRSSPCVPSATSSKIRSRNIQLAIFLVTRVLPPRRRAAGVVVRFAFRARFSPRFLFRHVLESEFRW